jgi:hypothetical protein
MLVEYGGSRFVFPNTTDLDRVDVVSENKGTIYAVSCYCCWDD